MSADLLDPTELTDNEWPSNSEALRSYIGSVCRDGADKFVANVKTKMMVLRDGNFIVPVTINNCEYDNSYVCSLYAFSRYVKEELNLINISAVEWLVSPLLDGVGALMKWAELDKVVHINNWIFETNVYPNEWRPNVREITNKCLSKFPEHIICFGSLNYWANDLLIRDLVEGGYSLTAYRQIYVFDGLEKTYLRRRDAKRDRNLLRTTKYRFVQNDDISESDYSRMAELYRLVYIQKHSTINPNYTADFIRLGHRSGTLRFVGARNSEGRLDGMVGLLSVPGLPLLSPLFGYDTTLDPALGLYRMMIALIFQAALDEGQNVNLGAANAGFKRNRGGQPIVEYKAFYSKHLPLARRATLAALSEAANRVMVPMVRWLEI